MSIQKRIERAADASVSTDVVCTRVDQQLTNRMLLMRRMSPNSRVPCIGRELSSKFDLCHVMGSLERTLGCMVHLLENVGVWRVQPRRVVSLISEVAVVHVKDEIAAIERCTVRVSVRGNSQRAEARS